MNPIFKELGEQEPLGSPLLLVGKQSDQLLIETTAFCRSRLKRQVVDHPDLIFFGIEDGSKTYAMETVRVMIEEMALPPFEEKVRYFILDRVDTMLAVHQNALLKALEEHPPYVKCILLTRSTSPLLPTVLSRVKKFFFDSSEQESPMLPSFQQPFSSFHQEVQNREESISFVECQGVDSLLQQMRLEGLIWTLEAQKAEMLHIKKKHILESLYAKKILENDPLDIQQ